jgi:hypothetical protein
MQPITLFVTLLGFIASTASSKALAPEIVQSINPARTAKRDLAMGLPPNLSMRGTTYTCQDKADWLGFADCGTIRVGVQYLAGLGERMLTCAPHSQCRWYAPPVHLAQPTLMVFPGHAPTISACSSRIHPQVPARLSALTP